MPTSYEAMTAQPPVVFPLSGPAPVCVSLGAPFWRGNMRPVHDERTGATFIELTGTVLHATTPAEKFYLEPSRQHEGLLHIRCCGTNKYWVAEQHERDGSSGWFICATADEPEEDPAKPSCTLFEFRTPAELAGQPIASLIHHQQKKNVLFLEKAGTTDMYNLEVRDYPGFKSDFVHSIILVRRLSLQKQLPRYVAFKGSNGKYLTLKDPYLQFSSDDIKDPAVVHETFTDEYGTVRIRPNGSDKFWTLRPEEGWIYAESGDAIYEPQPVYKSRTSVEECYADVNTLFRVVFKSGNYVALQSICSGKFCKRFTHDGKVECLSACVDDSSTISDVELEIEEPPVKITGEKIE